MDINNQKFSKEFHGRTLTLETSGYAEQANAGVLAKYGETVVLATVVMSHDDKELDYLPLKVDYEERFYAAGKILGSRFVRREGKASEEAVLSGRLIDRTIRPLFDERLRRDIQVVITILAIDGENDPDFVSLVAASTALAISDIPWAGPVAGVRAAQTEGKLIINHKPAELKKAPGYFESFVAGTEEVINMVELTGLDAKETEVLAAFDTAQKEIRDLVEFQKDIVKKVGKPKAQVALAESEPELKAKIQEFLAPRLEAAVYPEAAAGLSDKVERQKRLAALRTELFAELEKTFGEKLHKGTAEHLLEHAIDAIVHKNILESERRPDGRKLDEVRPLSAQVGLFERTHGSAMFMRGNTQALAITTLAPPGQEQLVETMESQKNLRFLLHYNFPPFSVGEIKPLRGPGRREIGHGALAMKTVEPLIPDQLEFPYTIRVVSEILSSNGSSSMATVCAAILSLMDAGVPIKKMAAGIAMGLMSDEAGNYKVLTDIQGPEDHYGDMDFKVAGTKDGVNAVQLDVKVRGITNDMAQKTLEQAKKARLHILDFMQGVLAEPRKKLSNYAPIIIPLQIDPEKIGMVIGPGGKVINGMIKEFGLTSIDIDDDGKVFVSADSPEKAERAVSEIKSLTKEFKPGEIVEGKIIKMLDFGAIVDLGGGKDGMIHISELKEGFVKKVDDVVKLGDFVRAKIIRVDADGHIGLSLKNMPAGGN